jgi:glycosyltransferase involved in cell wall biosynthesis
MQKFSVILPVRNGGEYLKECVNSILGQTLNDFNLIVLDNCSEDGGLEWIESLNDERIILHKSEKPLSIEKNWGRIKLVYKNEFMTMIGHDDILFPDYLAEMNSLIDRHPAASLYQSHFEYIDKDGITTRKCLPMDEVQNAFEFLASQMNETINSTGTGYMMRSKDFDKLGGMPLQYPNLIFSDYELWIRLMEISYKATAFAECFQYREHLSVSRITNGELYQMAFEKYVNFMVYLKNRDVRFAQVISRYGKTMLLKFCESLSHRILKTPINNRTSKVEDIIVKFRKYAAELIPGERFEPLDESRIRYAVFFDKNSISRNAFRLLKKIIR